MRAKSRLILILLFPFITTEYKAQVFTQTFVYSGGVQNFTVPLCVPIITIEARGARGGGNGGLGARMIGTFTVTPGQVLKILVGSAGQAAPNQVGNGGGGGSYVTNSANTPLCIAGGGGGTGHNESGGFYALIHGSTGTSGQPGDGGSLGGTNGNGGFESYTTLVVPNGGGGGGLLTNGGSAGAANGGSSFINGGAGGATTGGFGGGGGSNLFIYGCGLSPHGGSGGGGYSGGGAGGYNCNGAGGGGGSFNGGTAQSNTAGFQSGNGLVIISYAAASVSLTTSASNICSGSSATLSASGASTYTWNTGAFTSSIVVSPATSTNYIVTATNTLGCVSSATIPVSVFPLPSVTAVSGNTSICIGNTININATSAGNTINWYPVLTGGGTIGTTASGANFSVSPAVTTTYYAEAVSAAGALSQTFNFSGAAQNFTVPPGVNSLSIQAWGAQGWSGFYQGGRGGFAGGNLAVAPGQVLEVNVGGPGTVANGNFVPGGGGFNGGGNGQSNSSINAVGGGGGASDVRAGGNTLLHRVIVAGGGGGSTNNTNCWGGDGGGLVGVEGGSITPYLPGTGGSQTAGGTAGGALGIGGSGNGTMTPWNGGGGGGYYGGGTANEHSGGGGGSSYLGGVTSGSTTTGAKTGNGQVIISWATMNCNSIPRTPIIVTVNPIPVVGASITNPTICTGGTTALNGSGASTYTWTGGQTNGVPFSPVVATTYSVTGTSAAGCTSTNNANVSVVVNPLPPVTASASSPSVCAGNSVTLTGGGASTYTWTSGVTNNSPFAPAATANYTVTGTDANSCQNTATITVTVNPVPVLVSSAALGVICTGNTTTLNAGGASTYTWQPGSLPGGTVAVSPTVTTNYTVTASSAAGCTNNAFVTVTVNPLPVVTANSSGTAICLGNTATLSSSGANTYTWQPGLLNGATVTVSPASTTNYTVSATDVNGCVNSASVPLVVHPLPFVTANSSTTSVCAGQTVVLNGSGASTYTWTGGIINGVSFTPTVTTTYSVTGTSSLGCQSSNTAIIGINVNPLPIISIVAANSVICIGQTASMTASGANTYTWQPGAIVSASANVNPVSTTIYTVTGTAVSGCTNTAMQTISVNPLPVLTAGATSTVICIGNTTSLTVSGASTYTWIPGPLNGSTVAVSPAATTIYTVNATAATGCTNMAVQTISVNSLPVVGASASSPSICSGKTATLTGSGASTYTWQPGLLTGTSVTVSPAANTNYTVTGTAATGCTNTAIQSVSVVALPNVAASTGNSVICFGGVASMTATGALTYTWGPGVVTGSVVNSSPGSTTVFTVTGTAASGCTNTAMQTISVNPLPVVSASANTTVICVGGSASLSASGASTYTWQPGALTGSMVTVSPAVNTTYTVNATAATGCTNFAVQSVSVNPLPVVTATSSGSVICLGNTTSLTASGASTYTWMPGNLSGATVSVSPASTIIYTVTGTAATGCTNTASQQVSVNTLPNVGASASASVICIGVTTSLTATGAISYTWQPGVLTGATQTVSPASTTNYTVTGTANTGCTNTAVQTVSVNMLPVVTGSATSTVICFGQTVTLNGSGASTYNWTGGVTNGAVFTPTSTQSYTVTGTDNAGCTSTNNPVVTITVNPLPVVSTSVSNAVICHGDNTTLYGSGAATYTWTGGVTDGQAFSPTITASYSLSGTSTAGCTSTNNAVETITVNPLPVIVPVATTTVICNGGTVSLSGSGASTYTWSGGVTNAVAFTPSVTNTYTVTGTDINNCVSSETITVNVDTLPVVSVNITDTAICAGKQITLSGSGASTYTWSGGITNGAPFTPSATTTYSLNGTSQAGCTSTNPAVSAVTVYVLPVVTASTSAVAVCPGDSVKLNGGGAVTYTWTGASDGIYFIPQATSVYTVTGTDANGCENNAVITITVNALPQITVAGSKSVSCEAETVTLTASGAASYTWSNASAGISIAVSPTATISYSVTGTDVNGCISSTVFTQSVMPCDALLSVRAGDSSHVSCSGMNDGKITLVSVIPYSNYEVEYHWNPSYVCPDNSCTVIENLAAGSYSVMMKVTYTLNNVLVKQDSVMSAGIVILDVNGPCLLKVYTGITPNDDKINDFFKIDHISNYPNNRVSVYNRWGQQIFDVQGYDNETRFWPSQEQASKLISSTYFYVIDLGNGDPLIKGWVEVVK